MDHFEMRSAYADGCGRRADPVAAAVHLGDEAGDGPEAALEDRYDEARATVFPAFVAELLELEFRVRPDGDKAVFGHACLREG